MNVNEVSQTTSNASFELEKANKVIRELQERIKLYESQVVASSSVSVSRQLADNDAEESKEAPDVNMSATIIRRE